MGWNGVQVLQEFLQVEAFSKFSHSVVEVIDAQPDMPLVGAVSLHVSLLTFVLRVHADRLDYVDQVLGACVKKLEGKGKVKDSKATKQLVALLSAPLEKYKDVVVVLKLSNYARVMEHLDYETNKVMTVVLIQSILSNSTMISAPDKVTVYYYPVATMCSFPLKPCTFLVLTMGVFSFVIKGGCSI
jgi:vacuolar protein sorting-associated protein 35